jgi:HPt (histidine-containing phosphotransfer) domain-containing protein
MDNLRHETENFTADPSAANDLEGILAAFPQKDGFSLPALQQLTRDTDEDTTLRIMARFCQNLEETFHRIKTMDVDAHIEDVQKLMHRVAGTAELLGFVSLGRTSRELESQLKAETVSDTARNNLNQFMELSQEVLDGTHQHCPNLNHYLL